MWRKHFGDEIILNKSEVHIMLGAHFLRDLSDDICLLTTGCSNTIL